LDIPTNKILNALSEGINVLNDSVFELGTHFKYNLFVFEAITKKDRGIRTFYKVNFDKDPKIAVGITEICQRLYGVPGNQFYIFFKQHILHEDVQEEDLYFYTENRLAKWVL